MLFLEYYATSFFRMFVDRFKEKNRRRVANKRFQEKKIMLNGKKINLEYTLSNMVPVCEKNKRPFLSV